MKSTRYFFVGIMLFSLAFIATAIIPQPAHATPRIITTGEYPEAEGARCADVDYASNNFEAHSVEGATFVSSPNPIGPTIVHIGMYVDEITEVDEGANSFKMQGFLDLIWCDPRLAFNPSETGTQVEIFIEDDAHEELNNIWWPHPEFVNEDDPVSTENLTLLVHADGTVEYRSRFGGHLATNFNLHAFPFDQQNLYVEIESFEWASDTMVFLDQKGIVGFSDEFHIPEWNVTNITENIESKKEPRDHSEFSEFTAIIHIKRDPGVYTTKVMIPLGIIILISMVIFWMDPKSFEDRLGTSMTGLLTAVAYQFISSQNLPKHVYNTYLDSYVFLSFLVILFGIAESGFVAWLVSKGKEQQASLTDKLSRFFMPLLYVGMIIIMYFVYTKDVVSDTVSEVSQDTPVSISVPTSEPSTSVELPATNMSTPTQEPTAEVPPATEVSSVELQSSYTEDFEGNLDNWSSFMTSGIDGQVENKTENGNLRIQLSPYDDKIPRVYWVNNSFSYTDVQIEMVTTNNGNNANGVTLVCHYNDSGWYEFTVSNAGLYSIEAFDTSRPAQEGQVSLATGGSPAIKTGKETNTYTAVCKGGELSLYINGILVKSLTDSQFNYAKGEIGFGASSPQMLPVDVQFDSLLVSNLE